MNMFALVAIIAATALEPGVGRVHFAVSTKSAEAQKFFDQGMAYLYGWKGDTLRVEDL